MGFHRFSFSSATQPALHLLPPSSPPHWSPTTHTVWGWAKEGYFEMPSWGLPRFHRPSEPFLKSLNWRLFRCSHSHTSASSSFSFLSFLFLKSSYFSRLQRAYSTQNNQRHISMLGKGSGHCSLTLNLGEYFYEEACSILPVLRLFQSLTCRQETPPSWEC